MNAPLPDDQFSDAEKMAMLAARRNAQQTPHVPATPVAAPPISDAALLDQANSGKLVLPASVPAPLGRMSDATIDSIATIAETYAADRNAAYAASVDPLRTPPSRVEYDAVSVESLQEDMAVSVAPEVQADVDARLAYVLANDAPVPDDWTGPTPADEGSPDPETGGDNHVVADPDAWPHETMSFEGMTIEYRQASASAAVALTMANSPGLSDMARLSIFSTFLVKHMSETSFIAVVSEMMGVDVPVGMLQKLVVAIANAE